MLHNAQSTNLMANDLKCCPCSLSQIKLVDVEKVEWSNRRSYSAIGLFLGNREGRVLLRCDQGLEDWFELLDVSGLSGST